MENMGKTKQQGPVDAPPSSLNQLKQSGFDSVDMNNRLIRQNRPTRFQSEATAVEKTRGGHFPSQSVTSSPQSTKPEGPNSHVSISMPSSPLTMERSPFAEDVIGAAAPQTITSGCSDGVAKIAEPRQAGFHPPRSTLTEGSPNGGLGVTNNNNNPRIDRFKDRTFDSFKTWSGKFERQLSNLRGKQPATPPAGPPEATANPEIERLPVDRYFDALEGPELETLRASEVLMLPEDRKWPFLLRFPISCFGICLGVSSQAIMWKTLATSPSMAFLHVTGKVNLVLWSVSVALVGLISVTYALKAILYFEAVRREYYHPIRVNFFFAPWIALLFLALGVPPRVAQSLHPAAWYALMAPILALELKIYGQWMSGGQRRLSMVANPSNHLSVVGNFVGALLGASMGLREGPIFFFSVGLAHYTVLFVTLYQRLPTNATLPKELHPVFFLFVAAPSVASMAWAKIHGSFDDASRIAYFIALFLYFSLAVRVNFFRGFKFSVAWWAYTFPMTGASIATIKYSIEVTNVVTQALSILLSATATLTVTSLLVTTIIHAFVLRDLFPNDIAIAISDRRSKHTKKWFHHHRRHSSSDTKDIENYLKFSDDGHSDVHAAN